MWLFRFAFWGLVVVMLYPTAEQQKKYAETVNAAHAQVTDYCNQHEEVCKAGGAVWSSFLKTAEYGMKQGAEVLIAQLKTLKQKQDLNAGGATAGKERSPRLLSDDPAFLPKDHPGAWN